MSKTNYNLTQADMTKLIEDVSGIKVKVEHTDASLTQFRLEAKENNRDLWESMQLLRSEVTSLKQEVDGYKSKLRGGAAVLAVVFSAVVYLSDKVFAIMSK